MYENVNALICIMCYVALHTGSVCVCKQRGGGMDQHKKQWENWGNECADKSLKGDKPCSIEL